MVGIPAAARQRAGGYSMGMRQRLGLAAAMLADPQVLLLDEPANGLDPEGIRWLRLFLRHLSSQGKTILISSHMLQEVEQTVDDVVIIANGRFIQQGSVADLHGDKRSIVRTMDAPALVNALLVAGVAARAMDATTLEAIGDDMALVGDIALRAGLPIHELRSHQTDLEALFFQLTESPENRNRNLAEGTGASGTAGQDPADTEVAAYEGATL
jgi:ABC-2 type transport system ATP-binding protein